MEHKDIIDIIGYLASFFVAVAMVFTSILWLRWFSLVGNLLFTVYGIALDAYPVAITNGLIMLINIYHLIKIYRHKEAFRYLEVSPQSKYLTDFLQFHRQEIKKYFPDFTGTIHTGENCFFILRDMQVAGLIVMKKHGEAIEVVLDYAVRPYRDLKPGKFFFGNGKLLRDKLKASKVFAKSSHPEHKKYLRKLGFAPVRKDMDKETFELNISGN